MTDGVRRRTLLGAASALAAAGLGEALISPEAHALRPAQRVALGGRPRLLPAGARVAFIGDSIVQYNHAAAAGGQNLYTNDKGEMAWAQALDPRWRMDVWNDPTDTRGTRYMGGANQGIAGEASSAGLARFDSDVTPRHPAVVVIADGTNNLGSSPSPTVVSDCAGMVQKALAAGIVPVVCTIRPWGSGSTGDSAQKRSNYQAANAGLRALAVPGQVYVCDLAAAYGVPDAFAFIAAGYLIDGLHPNGYGAYVGGKALRDTLAGIIQPGNVVSALYGDGTTLLTTAQGAFSGGTAGGKGTNLTGTMPTGVNCYSSGSSSAVASLPANPDTGGKSIQLVVTPGGSAIELYPITLAANPAFSTAGAYVMAWAEVEFDAWPGWSGCYLKLAQVPNGTTFYASAMGTAGSGNAYPEAKRLFMATPAFKTDTATPPTALAPSVVLTVNNAGATGTGTFKLHRWGVHPAADPHLAWNA